MSKLKIAVICGGNSTERSVSLECGKNVFASLNRLKYEPYLVSVSENLAWKDETRNLDLDFFSTKNGVNKETAGFYDLAFLAMPGTFGEDGQLQAILDLIQLPYTHSGRLASAIAMNKAVASETMVSSGILTPRTIEFNSSLDLTYLGDKLSQNLSYPFILKPNTGGSSISTYKIVEELELVQALKELAKDLPNQIILAQEFIVGRELTCPVMGNSGDYIRALEVGEILTGADFFDYNAKYTDATTQEIFPAELDRDMTKKVKQTAIKAHQLLGCDGLTRSDFLLTQNNELYYLETNTNPGMSQASLCPKAGKLEFGSMSKFLDEIINLALKKIA